MRAVLLPPYLSSDSRTQTQNLTERESLPDRRATWQREMERALGKDWFNHPLISWARAATALTAEPSVGMDLFTRPATDFQQTAYSQATDQAIDRPDRKASELPTATSDEYVALDEAMWPEPSSTMVAPPAPLPVHMQVFDAATTAPIVAAHALATTQISAPVLVMAADAQTMAAVQPLREAPMHVEPAAAMIAISPQLASVAQSPLGELARGGNPTMLPIAGSGRAALPSLQVQLAAQVGAWLSLPTSTLISVSPPQAVLLPSNLAPTWRSVALLPASAELVEARVVEAPSAEKFSDVPELEPLRLHMEWGEQGVRLWLGVDAQHSADTSRLAQQLMRWLSSQGAQLLSLVCNGRVIYAAESHEQDAAIRRSDGARSVVGQAQEGQAVLFTYDMNSIADSSISATAATIQIRES